MRFRTQNLVFYLTEIYPFYLCIVTALFKGVGEELLRRLREDKYLDFHYAQHGGRENERERGEEEDEEGKGGSLCPTVYVSHLTLKLCTQLTLTLHKTDFRCTDLFPPLL